MQKDITRYSREQVLEGIKNSYPESYLERALSEFGYEDFPESGLSDKGFRIFMKRVSEIDEAESDLKPVKTKDLSSKVLETRVKIKKDKREKSNGYLSIVGKDLGKVGKGIVGTAYIFLSPFVIPTANARYADKAPFPDNLASPVAFVLNAFSPGYYGFEFAEGNPTRGFIVLGAHLGLNLASGIYEYVRHLKGKSYKSRSYGNYASPFG